MKESVEATWGWDEAWQASYFREHFGAVPRQVIGCEGKDVGFLDVEDHADCIRLVNIEIVPGCQCQGIGTQLIQDLLERAAQRSICVQLQVLKVNLRAQALYERLGFHVTGETPTHFRMQSR